jgi:transcriptional regulator with XRE-family HTH domain
VTNARHVPKWSTEPLPDELPRILAERGISISAMARAVGVNQSHLSRVIRRERHQTRSAELAAKIAVELGLPGDYWPEYRLAKVVQKARADGAYRDRLYAELPESDR